MSSADRGDRPDVGARPHPGPWPQDPGFDPELLAQGDQRNVLDRYRYWRTEAVRADVDRRRHPLHVAVENWQRDQNTGSVVRSANAFAATVHIVGRRRWNRRGAMRTEAYLPVHHHADIAHLAGWATERGIPVLGVDNVAGASDLRTVELPREVVLVFGEEGPGLTAEARDACDDITAIPQFGSTRSINAAAAASVVMWEWIRRHAGTGFLSPAD